MKVRKSAIIRLALRRAVLALVAAQGGELYSNQVADHPLMVAVHHDFWEQARGAYHSVVARVLSDLAAELGVVLQPDSRRRYGRRWCAAG